MALEQHACGVVLGLAPSGRRYDSLDRRLSEWDQAQMVQTDRHACSERLVPRYSITAILDQLLYQLGARSLVLDQHDIRSKQALLLAHGAFERGIFEPPAQYTEEEEVLAFDTPCRAHREIAELGRLVGGVPALHDAVEALG